MPLYWMVVTSLRDQAGFFEADPWLPPQHPTLDNYRLVLDSGFPQYLLNSLVVTTVSVLIIVTVSLLAAHAVVRGRGRFLRGTFSLLLLGLAIPLQATIIPVFLIVQKLGLYDSLWAVILPYVGFGIPVTFLILTNFLRDVPASLFEAMEMDGAGQWTQLVRLVLPLSRGGIVAVCIYNALQVWNGFLFPLILTSKPEVKVLPLALFDFQTNYAVNVPAVLAAVILSTLPLLALYVVGRRQLIAGLTAGAGK
ncbi:MAG TPA: carbohydrate ABC transporter permease [Kineosporiaceae bacterium]|nr:carbohydrate ABC transporter permease [Kineosporiaceae bacterium]